MSLPLCSHTCRLLWGRCGPRAAAGLRLGPGAGPSRRQRQRQQNPAAAWLAAPSAPRVPPTCTRAQARADRRLGRAWEAPGPQMQQHAGSASRCASAAQARGASGLRWSAPALPTLPVRRPWHSRTWGWWPVRCWDRWFPPGACCGRESMRCHVSPCSSHFAALKAQKRQRSLHSMPGSCFSSLPYMHSLTRALPQCTPQVAVGHLWSGSASPPACRQG